MGQSGSVSEQSMLDHARQFWANMLRENGYAGGAVYSASCMLTVWTVWVLEGTLDVVGSLKAVHPKYMGYSI